MQLSERNSSGCPHCSSKLLDKRDVEPFPAEPLNAEPHNSQLSPQQLAVNVLHAALQDREELQQRIDTVSLTFFYILSPSINSDFCVSCFFLYVYDYLLHC